MECRAALARWDEPLLAVPHQLRLSPKLRDDGLASDGALTKQDPWPCACRQIDVDAASEADQTDPFAGLDLVAFANEGQDATRDQARDLSETDPDAHRRLHDD